MTEPDPEATARIRKLLPFADHLGIEVLRNAPDEVRARLRYAEHLCTAGGLLHGGALMALADTAGAMCATLNLPEDAGGTATVESKTNFLRGLRAGHAVATAHPLHAGRRFVVVETEITDDAGTRYAKVTQTQSVL